MSVRTSIPGRFAQAWKVLPRERRLAAYASIGLFLTLFLPWYQETVIAVGTRPQTASASVTGWQAFSFVEAAALLVAAAVLTLLFQRAEGRAFHLPGGDGGVITGAGLWACILVVWRIFDKQVVHVRGPGTTVSGVDWGIFVALAVAGLLAYTGSRIRAAHQPEPPLPWEGDGAGAEASAAPRAVGEARGAASGAPPAPAPGAPGAVGEAQGAALGPPRPVLLADQRTVGWLTAPPKDRPVATPEKPAEPIIPRPVAAPRHRQPPEDELTIPLEGDE